MRAQICCVVAFVSQMRVHELSRLSAKAHSPFLFPAEFCFHGKSHAS